MRKLFLLIPALVLALMTANATTHKIGSGTSNILGTTVASAADGDIIVLTDNGPYINSKSAENDYTRLNKNLTIQADDGKTPVIQYEVPFRSTDGKTVKFIGVTFDGTSLTAYDWYFRFYDANNNNLEFEDCEFRNVSTYYIFDVYTACKANSLKLTNCYLHNNSKAGVYNRGTLTSLEINNSHFANFTGSGYSAIENYAGSIESIEINGCEFDNSTYYAIYGAKGSSINTLTIDNCYFHNNARSAVYLDSKNDTQACNSLTIENSTFADISEGYNVIDFECPSERTFTTDASISVNHCTFYNHPKRAIYWQESANLAVSNCIFAQPSASDYKSVECVGGTITKCLSYNSPGYSSAATPSGNLTGNPYFVNASSGSYDFTPASFSVAHNAGTDSKTLGDYLRWTSNDSAHPTTKNLTAAANILKPAIEAAWPGDTISLAAGNYEQGENYTIFDKNLVIKSATSTPPVLKFTVPTKLQGGARVEFNGLKFDMTNLNSQTWYEHLISVEDASDGNKLIFENCELYNYPINSSAIYCASNKKVDSLIVNNCKFHDMKKCCMWIDNTSIIGATVTNSTFYNISTVTGDYSAAILDFRNPTGDVKVDHCTFYECYAMSTSYGAVYVKSTPDVTVSNNIFAMSASTGGQRAIWLPGDSGEREVKNCLVYNYTNDDGQGIRGGNVKTNCIFGKNPLFTNAAGGIFSYAGDWTTGNVSPARGKGTDGSDLGDKNWYTDETIPSTNFASPYAFTGTVAVVADKMEHDGSNIHSTGSGGSATWKIHTTKACAVQVTLNLLASYDLGHNYQVEIFDADGNSLGALSEGGYHKSRNDSLLSGNILLPEIGDYKIVLTNNLDGTTTSIKGVTLSYVGGAVQNVTNSATCTTDINEAWFSSNGSRADGKISFPGSTMTSAWVRWNIHVETSDFYNVLVNFDKGSADHTIGVKIYSSEKTVYDKPGSRSSAASPIDLGRALIPAGDYIMEYTNYLDWSTAKLVSIQIVPYIAPTTALPATLKANDAIMSELAYAASADADETAVIFAPDGKYGYIQDQWAQWKVSVASAGTFLFTMNVTSTNSQSYRITIFDSENNIVETFDKNPDGKGDKTIKHYFNLAAGNYFVKAQNTYQWSNGHLVSLEVTKPSLLQIDESATTNTVLVDNERKDPQDIQIIRTIVAGMYNTICLPFDVKLSEMNDLFGEDFELEQLESAILTAGILDLNFTRVTTINRGTPYLIKIANDVVNPVFQQAVIKTTVGDISTSTNANFIGTLIKSIIPASPDNLYLTTNDEVYFPEEDKVILGTRAYFHVHDVPAGVIRHARIVRSDQTATDIELVEDGNWKEVDSSRKIIENGQLIIIRDGIRYNVMGIKLQ